MNAFGPKPICHHRYEWNRYLVSLLCAITIALGSCSAAQGNPVANASGPGVQASSATASQAQPTATAQVDDCAEDPVSAQKPCSCFTDYFFRTKTKPWCSALDWVVVLPVEAGALLLITPIALMGGV